MTADERAYGINGGLVRLSVGLEAPASEAAGFGRPGLALPATQNRRSGFPV